MNMISRALLTLNTLALIGIGNITKAQTLVTFDDLPNGNISPSIPKMYSGITWDTATGWFYYSPAAYGQTNLFPPHSGNNVAYSHSTDSIFTFNTPQIFQGAWFAGNSQEYFVLEDSNGNMLATSSTLTLTSKPTFLSSGYNGLVSIVDVHSTNTTNWVFDDVTYGTTATPEPGTYALLVSLGLTGAAFLLRRRKFQE